MPLLGNIYTKKLEIVPPGMEPRTQKKLIIGAVYSLILIVFLGALYFLFFYHAPVCTDGIQNGKETGVDCGGTCSNACQEIVTGQPFTIEEVAIMPGGRERYDILGKIYNPNDTEGASNFRYTLELKNGSGEVIKPFSPLVFDVELVTVAK